MVYEADNQLRFYVNGELDGTLAVGTYGSITNSLPTVIGASLSLDEIEQGLPDQEFDGKIDEVRLSNATRSLAWINTSYTNQDNPTGFFSLGDEEEISITNNPPTADLVGPSVGIAGVAVQFDGNLSSDPDDDPLTYGWSFGDNNYAAVARPIHTYSSEGVYIVKLNVTDGEFYAYDNHTINILPVDTPRGRGVTLTVNVTSS
jgi:PKD repeat protein